MIERKSESDESDNLAEEVEDEEEQEDAGGLEEADESMPEFVEEHLNVSNVLDPRDLVLSSGEISSQSAMQMPEPVERLESAVAGAVTSEDEEEEENVQYDAVEDKLYNEEEEEKRRRGEVDTSRAFDVRGVEAGQTIDEVGMAPAIGRHREHIGLIQTDEMMHEADVDDSKYGVGELRDDRSNPWEQKDERLDNKYKPGR